jgi:lysophospholipase L1-like esterase
VLDQHTDLVVITVGGNDAGFPDALIECGESDCTVHEATYQARISAQQANVQDLLADIRNGAPNARVILLGYPRLFSEPVVACGPLGVYSSPEGEMINRLAVYFDQVLAAAVASVGDPSVEYLSVLDTFDGGACPKDMFEIETINAVVGAEAGGGDFHVVAGSGHVPDACRQVWFLSACVSRESFHPNAFGTQEYADTLTAHLAQNP